MLLGHVIVAYPGGVQSTQGFYDLYNLGLGASDSIAASVLTSASGNVMSYQPNGIAIPDIAQAIVVFGAATSWTVSQSEALQLDFNLETKNTNETTSQVTQRTTAEAKVTFAFPKNGLNAKGNVYVGAKGEYTQDRLNTTKIVVTNQLQLQVKVNNIKQPPSGYSWSYMPTAHLFFDYYGTLQLRWGVDIPTGQSWDDLYTNADLALATPWLTYQHAANALLQNLSTHMDTDVQADGSVEVTTRVLNWSPKTVARSTPAQLCIYTTPGVFAASATVPSPPPPYDSPIWTQVNCQDAAPPARLYQDIAISWSAPKDNSWLLARIVWSVPSPTGSHFKLGSSNQSTAETVRNAVTFYPLATILP